MFTFSPFHLSVKYRITHQQHYIFCGITHLLTCAALLPRDKVSNRTCKFRDEFHARRIIFVVYTLMCRRENKLGLTEHYVFWRQNKRQFDSAAGGGNPICLWYVCSRLHRPDKRVFDYVFFIVYFL